MSCLAVRWAAVHREVTIKCLILPRFRMHPRLDCPRIHTKFNCSICSINAALSAPGAAATMTTTIYTYITWCVVELKFVVTMNLMVCLPLQAKTLFTKNSVTLMSSSVGHEKALSGWFSPPLYLWLKVLLHISTYESAAQWKMIAL